MRTDRSGSPASCRAPSRSARKAATPPNAPPTWLRYLSRLGGTLAPGIAVAALFGVVWWLASGQFLVRLVALVLAAYLVWAFASSA